MATAHLSVKVGKVGKATPHVEYISRLGKYAQRLEQGEKLEKTESGNMPDWAQKNPILFWQAADQYERKNGYVYREHEIALPRELNAEQRAELVREWVKNELGDRHAYTWAIHNKTALDGGEQPHVHLMFSERLNDGIKRDPEQYFKRYNAKFPERGGAKKHNVQGTHTERAEQLKQMRDRWEQLYNAHIDKHLEQRTVLGRSRNKRAKISMKSLKEQGITDRKAEPKLTPSESAALQRKAAADRAAYELIRELGVVRPVAPTPTKMPEPEIRQPEHQHRPIMDIFKDFGKISFQINKLIDEQEKSATELKNLKDEQERIRQLAWDYHADYTLQKNQKSGFLGLMRNDEDNRKTEILYNKIKLLNEKYEKMKMPIQKAEQHNQAVQERTNGSLKILRDERGQVRAELNAIPLEKYDDMLKEYEKTWIELGKQKDFNSNYSRIYGELYDVGFRGDFGEKIHRCAVVEWCLHEVGKMAKAELERQQREPQRTQQPITAREMERTPPSRDDDWDMER